MIKIFLLFLLLLASQLGLASIFVQVNKSKISSIEELELKITANEITGNVPELDLSQLNKDFTVLSQSKFQSISITNGRSSSSVEWSLRLGPKRTGKLNIPSFKIGKDTSDPISITVTNVQSVDFSKQAVFLTAKINNKQPSIQEQVIYTVSLYTNQRANNNLAFPISVANALVKTLGSGATQQTKFKGRAVWVKHYYYAIYPQKVGKISVPKIKQNIQIASGNSRSNLVLFAPAIELSVQDIANNYPINQHWLPATKVSLSSKFITNPPIFKVGEVVIREVNLSVSGQSKSQLPPLPLPTSNAFEQYNDESTLSEKIQQQGVESNLTQKVIIIPNQPGKQILPELRVSWFDVISQTSKVAILAAQEISVLPASIDNKQIINQPVAQKISQSITAELPKEITQIADNNPTQPKSDYQLLASVFFGLWILTLLWCYYGRQGKEKKAQKTNKKPKNIDKTLLKNIQKSCQQNDAKATQNALNIWLLARHPNYVTMREFADSLDNAELRYALIELNQSLHQANNEQIAWQGKAFWQIFSSVISLKNPTNKTNSIPNLYPDSLSK